MISPDEDPHAELARCWAELDGSEFAPPPEVRGDHLAERGPNDPVVYDTMMTVVRWNTAWKMGQPQYRAAAPTPTSAIA
jgi:hypothetical protein